MASGEINAYWLRNSRYYREPRSPEDIAEQTRLYEQAQIIGKWENAHHTSELKRLTWWYSDFGSFVPKEYVTPELLTERHTEITESKMKEAQNKMVKLPSKEAMERLRENYPIGARVELLSMNDPYSTLQPGDKGTVTHIDSTGTIFADWDSGSTLGLVYGEDSYRRVVEPIYKNAAEFWSHLKEVSVDLNAALTVGGKYIGAKAKAECTVDEIGFCRELFAAMYMDSDKTAPAKFVYPLSYAEANDSSKIVQYNVSRRQNTLCARAIDDSIHDSRYKPNLYNFDLAAMNVVHEFGFDRVNMVLAKNIQAIPGHTDNEHAQWAQGFTIPEDSFNGAIIESHRSLLDSFATSVHGLYKSVAAERGLPEEKPSVLKQIRDAQKAPQPPRGEKTPRHRKNKDEAEH